MKRFVSLGLIGPASTFAGLLSLGLGAPLALSAQQIAFDAEVIIA